MPPGHFHVSPQTPYSLFQAEDTCGSANMAFADTRGCVHMPFVDTCGSVQRALHFCRDVWKWPDCTCGYVCDCPYGTCGCTWKCPHAHEGYTWKCPLGTCAYMWKRAHGTCRYTWKCHLAVHMGTPPGAISALPRQNLPHGHFNVCSGQVPIWALRRLFISTIWAVLRVSTRAVLAPPNV